MEVKTKKEELLEWLEGLQDPKIISELYTLKKRASFDFDKEFTVGYTPEEAKRETIGKIREWWPEEK
jgi:hypothetical protein